MTQLSAAARFGITVPAPDGHPRWCDRQHCHQRGEHRAQRFQLPLGEGDETVLALWLTHVIGWPNPDATLAMTFTDETIEVMLTLDQLSHLARAARMHLLRAGWDAQETQQLQQIEQILE